MITTLSPDLLPFFALTDPRSEGRLDAVNIHEARAADYASRTALDRGKYQLRRNFLSPAERYHISSRIILHLAVVFGISTATPILLR